MTTLCWSWATMRMSHIDVSFTSCNFQIVSHLVLVFARSSLEWTVQFSVHVQLTKKNKQRKAIQNDSNLGYRTSEVNVTPTHYPRRHKTSFNKKTRMTNLKNIIWAAQKTWPAWSWTLIPSRHCIWSRKLHENCTF